MSLLCLGFVGKIAALPWCGRLAARSGAHRLLWIGGLGIIPVSAMWLASDSLAYLGLLQVLSGAVWAAFELAMFLLFFDAIPRRRRVTVLTWYNFGNAAAMAAGALLGAVLLECVGCGRIGYLGLFAVSSAARAASFALFPTAIRSRVQSGSVIATRMVAVRPGSGVVGRPIVPNVFGTICELHGGAGVPAQATQVLASSASRPASLGDRPSTHCQPGRRLIAGRIESGLQANAFGKAPHPVAALEPGRRRTAPSGRPAARVA
jgi:MFS family permease